MNLPTPPEKLPNPFREDIMAENGMTTVGWIYHPTQQELVDKLNEYHDFSEQLVAYLKEREHLPNCTLIRYGTGYGCNCKAEPAQEPPQEKECDNCKIEDGGIIRLTNERMCADCGRDMSILSPSQEKECKHNWIGYSSTERMECTKCGEKSSPSQQTVFEKEVAKLPQDGTWRQLIITEEAWVKDGKVDNHSIRSYVNGPATRPSQQIDVKALLEEYAEKKTRYKACPEKGYCRMCEAGCKERMSEIEEIIKNNLK